MKRFILAVLVALSAPTSAGQTLVIQNDNSYQVDSEETNPNGLWRATSDPNGAPIKIWNRAGLQWGELPNSQRQRVVGFSPDGSKLLVVGMERGNGAWSAFQTRAVPEGALLREVKIENNADWHFRNTDFSTIEAGSVVRYGWETGRVVTPLQDKPPFGSYGFSRAGTLVAGGRGPGRGARGVQSGDGTARIWRVRDGKLLAQIDAGAKNLGSAGVSEDGKWLATEGTDETYRRGDATFDYSTPNTPLFLWNVARKIVVRRFDNYGFIHGKLSFSPDNKEIWLNGGRHRFGIATGKRRDIPEPLHPVPAKLEAGELLFSPDGSRAAMVFGGDILALWNPRTGKIERSIQGYVQKFQWIGDATLQTQTLGAASFWSVPGLQLIRTNDFSPPPKSQDQTNEYSGGLSVAPDGKTILTTAEGYANFNQLLIWNADGQTLRGKGVFNSRLNYSAFNRMLWIDNLRVAIGSGQSLLFFNTQTAQIERQWKDNSQPSKPESVFDEALVPLQLEQNGSVLKVYSQREAAIFRFNCQTFELLSRAPTKDENGVAIKELRSPIRAVSPNGTWLGGSNGVRVSGFTDAKGDFQWFIITPEGFYDSSENGDTPLRWRDETGFWPQERSRAQFKKPERVRAALENLDLRLQILK